MGEPANSGRFDVVIDGIDLGSFTSLEGLTAEYEVRTYSEGGENGYVHQLPGRLKFGNIKVTRPIDKKTKGLGELFGTLGKGSPMKRRTATVTAYNDNRDPVAEWTFEGVWPVRYAGPSLATDGSKVAIETFEFAHHGFK